MIIKRKLCTYGQLLNDPITFNAIENAYKSNGLSKKQMHDEMGYAFNIMVLNTNIETGLTAKVFGDLKAEIERLDLSHPFDNGLTYLDVTDTICLPNKDGSTLTQILISKKPDCTPLIVQIVAFKKDGDYIRETVPDEIDFDLHL